MAVSHRVAVLLLLMVSVILTSLPCVAAHGKTRKHTAAAKVQTKKKTRAAKGAPKSAKSKSSQKRASVKRTSRKKATSRTRTTRRKVTTKKSLTPTPARPTELVNTNTSLSPQNLTEDTTSSSTPVSLENPEALRPFFAELYRLENGTSQALHILHFGDSHTAADGFTGRMREHFQTRFGDGGAGYTFAGTPFIGYRCFSTKRGATSGWFTEGLKRDTPVDHLVGLGGVSIRADKQGESTFVEADADHVELNYLQQPGGGSFLLSDNGQDIEVIRTDGPLGPAFYTYKAGGGRHRLAVRTLTDAPVRLFGWVTENKKGITYESIGVNGAEASAFLKWDEPMQATYLRRRNPRLIVVAYGTNESSNGKLSEEMYREMFFELIRRCKRLAPEAAILVLGPPDRYWRIEGAWQPIKRLDWVVDVQRSACRELGCTFWDQRNFMGGAGSMRQWIRSGLAQPDYAHLTMPGYHRLADGVFFALMAEYESYKKQQQAGRSKEEN